MARWRRLGGIGEFVSFPTLAILRACGAGFRPCSWASRDLCPAVLFNLYEYLFNSLMQSTFMAVIKKTITEDLEV